MSPRKTEHSTAKVIDENGKIIYYLDASDEEKGLDIELDLQGYTIITID